MTISSKLVDIAGLAFAVSDETDPIDVNGFSDILNVVGAKTAKFSGGSTMQANAGLRLGITQVKITNAGAGGGRTGTVIRGAFVSTAATGEVVVVDFGAPSILATITGTIQYPSGSSTTRLEVSVDDIVYTTAATVSGSNLNNTYPPSNQTYRFARIFVVTNPGVVTPQTITEAAITSDVTVNIRSSATVDTTDGTVILASKVILNNTSQTFTTELLLTGAAQFFTLQIVSFSTNPVDTTLSEITSIKET